MFTLKFENWHAAESNKLKLGRSEKSLRARWRDLYVHPIVSDRQSSTSVAVSRLQVTSHPVQRNFARLKITEAYSIIPGAPDLHVKQGSSLRLECQLMAATEKPLYVFWYRQDRMINYEEPGVDVKLTSNGSILTVNKTKLTHDGNYTCTPSNARPASIMVHVIEGEREVYYHPYCSLIHF